MNFNQIGLWKITLTREDTDELLTFWAYNLNIDMAKAAALKWANAEETNDKTFKIIETREIKKK
jgi:hypothetical protein